uniref:uncharacterized protein LOC120331864 n=1 Tax=Styela clava TaxID=7725 RepID=UPI00193A7C7D|nr:uncharacterized protein LOC120331864 [Styela clava]
MKISIIVFVSCLAYSSAYPYQHIEANFEDLTFNDKGKDFHEFHQSDDKFATTDSLPYMTTGMSEETTEMGTDEPTTSDTSDSTTTSDSVTTGEVTTNEYTTGTEDVTEYTTEFTTGETFTTEAEATTDSDYIYSFETTGVPENDGILAL